ncbi:MAG TPA: copper chaperone PCu(A)C [Burkholderiales bacterium]|nr:copper chaperone PCu(A)C [Burkholderiales bacterium]
MAAAALSVIALTASAARAQGVVTVENAWARATVPGQKVAGVYLDIRSDTPAALVGVRSPAAGASEIHSMSNEGGVMRMRRLDRLDLPGGQTVRLAPGGNHIMLLDIKGPLQAGARVPVVLIVEQKGKKKWIQVQVQVRPLTP